MNRYFPMKATLSDNPELLLKNPLYRFEWKYDGRRVFVRIEEGVVIIRSPNQEDITDRYPELTGIWKQVKVKSAVLDGEIVCFDERGLPNFNYLQQRMNPKNVSAVLDRYPVTFVAFDLVEANGIDLTTQGESTKWSVRKETLLRLVDADHAGDHDAGARWKIKVAKHVTDGKALLEKVRELNAEGVMAKDINGYYYQGKRHTTAWMKLKPRKRDTFVVCGYTLGKGARASQFGAVVLGKPDGSGGGYRHVGRAGSGLNGASLAKFTTKLLDLRTDVSPFEKGIKVDKLASWTRPEIVVEVLYAEISNFGKLRWPIFVKEREDMSPADVLTEIVQENE